LLGAAAALVLLAIVLYQVWPALFDGDVTLVEGIVIFVIIAAVAGLIWRLWPYVSWIFRILLFLLLIIVLVWLVLPFLSGKTLRIAGAVDTGGSETMVCLAETDKDKDGQPDLFDLNDDNDQYWDWAEPGDQGGDPCVTERPKGFPANALPTPSPGADTSPGTDTSPPTGTNSTPPASQPSDNQSPSALPTGSNSGQPSGSPSTPSATPTERSCSVPSKPGKSVEVVVDPGSTGTPAQLDELKANGAHAVYADRDPGGVEAMREWLTDAQCRGLEGGMKFSGLFATSDSAAEEFARDIKDHPNFKVALLNSNEAGSVAETKRQIQVLEDATGGKPVCVQVNREMPDAGEQRKYLRSFENECLIVGVFPYASFGSTLEMLPTVSGPAEEASSEVIFGVQAFEDGGKMPTADQVGNMVDRVQSGGDLDRVVLITQGSYADKLDYLPRAVKQAELALAS
jgi:hypothetical protein